MRAVSSLVSLYINQAKLKNRIAEQAVTPEFYSFEIISKLKLNKLGVKATMVILSDRPN